jgi:RecT family.
MNKQNEILAMARNELPQLKAILQLSKPKGTDTQTLALQELEFLQMHAMAKPEIYECVPLSIISAIKAVLKQNLTLDPYAGLVYVKTRNVKINNEWVKALEIQPSANGIISIARQAGRVMDIERPEVIKDNEGRVIGVKVRYLVPSYSREGKRQYDWRQAEFDESDFARWRISSHRENGRNKTDSDNVKLNYANALYTSFKGGIDPEFARAKSIRHGLKKLGTNLNEGIKDYQAPVQNLIDPDSDIEAGQDDQVFDNMEDATKHAMNLNNWTETKGTGKVKDIIPDANLPKQINYGDDFQL